MTRPDNAWWRNLAPVLLLLLTFPLYAQDESAGGADEADAAEDEQAVVDEPLIDDDELDEQGFDPAADDDFIPSEDISADAPIAFPTDI